MHSILILVCDSGFHRRLDPSASRARFIQKPLDSRLRGKDDIGDLATSRHPIAVYRASVTRAGTRGECARDGIRPIWLMALAVTMCGKGSPSRRALYSLDVIVL